ncbi:hypothetical protein BJ165DRAFT_1426866 [Panaeolus papilionaceus]|nr:hypothetical protein BJ165DRAFT_1426866 [Panaeolus papilionaceus]
MKSPFWDPSSESQHKKSKSATKPKHVDDYVNEQWGNVLDQVGKKATVKARLELQKREQRVDEHEHEHDWFGSRTKANTSGSVKANAAPQAPKRSPTEPKRCALGSC